MPQYHTNSILSDFNEISYLGRLWFSELIPDIEKFLPIAIFKMATTIPHKFNIVRFQRNFMLLDYDVRNWFPTLQNFYRSPFSKWPPQYRKNSTLFDFKVSFSFIYGHFVCCWLTVYRKHIIWLGRLHFIIVRL